MEVNIPEIVAEVTATFERYEKALVTNDVALLNELFWNDPRTIRYGTQEILYGPTLRPFVLAELIGRTLLDRKGRGTVVTVGVDHHGCRQQQQQVAR
jgi:hypothetical protein